MAANRTTRKPRRPKPVNYGRQRTLRLGEAEEAAVAGMRAALAKIRRVDPSQVSFSEAHRLLLVDAERAARILARQPEAWKPPQIVDVPEALWVGLNECRDAVVHSRGSMYAILRKVNFDEGPVTRSELLSAIATVKSSEAALERMEVSLVEMVSTLEAAADAEAAGKVL